MPQRQGPFGVNAAALSRELDRRAHEHRRQIAPRRVRLKRLESAAAELAEYAGLLAAEADALQAQQQALLRELAAPPPDPAQMADQLRLALETYRQATHELVSGVFSLIQPFLATDAPPHSVRADWRERAWLSERRTGSEGR